MSELNVYTAYESDDFPDETEFYLKSEADKVIAELEEKHKTEVKELLCLIRDKEYNFNRAFDSEEKELRRQKYKRCLAIADSCALRTVVAKMENRSFPTQKNSRRMILYPKWYKRWLAIAYTFKTNSTALQGKGN